MADGGEVVDSEFLDPEFDVEACAQKLLQDGTAISEHLAMLEAKSTQLDKQLRIQVSAHHGKLLSQATSIESLEDILSTLNQHISALKSSMDRVCGKTCELYNRAHLHTQQLERMHDTCNLLRAMMRIMNLSNKLLKSNEGLASRDLVKNSQMLQEMSEISQETDLTGISSIEKDLISIPKLISQVKEQARAALKQGLRAQNHALVGNALQAFCNLRCLGSQIETVLGDMGKDIDGCLHNLGKGEQEFEQGHRRQGSKGHSPAPGGVSRAPTTSSVLIRANLWTDVQKLVDSLSSASAQLEVLQLVLGKKKNNSTHQLLLAEIGWTTDIYPNFWQTVAGNIKERLSADSGLVKQTLETEYPKFLRLLLDVFGRVSGELKYELRDSLGALENSYLFKSLNRLMDGINLAFSSDSPPSDEEVEQIGSILANEMQVAQFDARLFQQICRNVAKSVKLFAAKAEQLLSTDGEASQVIDNPSPGQRRNVATVNALYKLRAIVLSHVDDRVNAESAPPEAIEALLRACDQLLALMRSAVQPLMLSIEDAVGAIIDTVHREDFAFGAPTDSAPAEQQCSLYMRELQSFISRVWHHYLSPFTCRPFIYEQSIILARLCTRLFLIHTTLVRPIGEGGRLRLAADFAQMELAISPLCRRINVDLGADYHTLRAMRHLLFESAPKVCESPMIGNEVPFWLTIQLLISASEQELPSPHQSAGWSIARYSQWLEDNENEYERLQFLRGTLESYARSVQAQNKTEYVANYPLLLDLLKRGLEKCKK